MVFYCSQSLTHGPQTQLQPRLSCSLRHQPCIIDGHIPSRLSTGLFSPCTPITADICLLQAAHLRCEPLLRHPPPRCRFTTTRNPIRLRCRVPRSPPQLHILAVASTHNHAGTVLSPTAAPSVLHLTVPCLVLVSITHLVQIQAWPYRATRPRETEPPPPTIEPRTTISTPTQAASRSLTATAT